MDELAEIINGLVHSGTSEPLTPAEVEARGGLLAKLFEYYRATSEADLRLLDVYVHETTEIPLDKLALGIKAILRSRPWPSLPKIADLWRASRIVAGMHSEQYHAGRYLPPPRDWPPCGKRHAIHAGEFEQINVVGVSAIGPGSEEAAGLIER